MRWRRKVGGALLGAALAWQAGSASAQESGQALDRLASAAEAALIWQRVEVGLLIIAVLLCGWAARSAARSAEAAKKEQSGGERPFAFLVVHSLDYDPIVGGQGGARPTLEGRQFRLAYSIRNFGRSACLVRRVTISFVQSASAANMAGRHETVAYPGWVIAPNGEEAGQVRHEAPWSLEELEAYRDESQCLFVRGEIQYEDLGGACYVRRFCLSKGFQREPAEEGGATDNYDRRIYSDPRWNIAVPKPASTARRAPAPPPPKAWPPAGAPQPMAAAVDEEAGVRVIPYKKK